MPPHCDSKDGPVVKAAQKALENNKVELILPFVKKEGESEVRKTFDLTMKARKLGAAAQEVADLYFFENVVRIHRAGEGAPYTGLKPAGLDVGPVIPVAEKTIESGSADNLVKLLTEAVTHEIHHRLEEVMILKKEAGKDLEHARKYTEAMLDLQVWSHKLYMAAKATAHDGPHQHED